MDPDSLPPLPASTPAFASLDGRDDAPRRAGRKNYVKIAAFSVLILFACAAVGVLAWYITDNSRDAAASQISSEDAMLNRASQARRGQDAAAGSSGSEAPTATPFIIPTIASIENEPSAESTEEADPASTPGQPSVTPAGKPQSSPAPSGFSPAPALSFGALVSPKKTRIPTRARSPSLTPTRTTAPSKAISKSPTPSALPITLAPTAAPQWSLTFGAASYPRTFNMQMPVYPTISNPVYIAYAPPPPESTVSPPPPLPTQPPVPTPLARLSATLKGPVQQGSVICVDNTQTFMTRLIDDFQVERLCDLFTNPVETPEVSCHSYRAEGIQVSELVFPIVKDTIDKCYEGSDPGKYILFSKVYFSCAASALNSASKTALSSCGGERGVFSSPVELY